MTRTGQFPIALTMGEPAGIGGELALKAWLDPPDGATPFFAIDDPRRLERLAHDLALDVPIAPIDAPEQCGPAFAGALPVLPLALPKAVQPGKPDPACAGAVLDSIARAAKLAMAGKVAAMVTNPIQKAALYDAGFAHPGHTEYLAELAGLEEPPVMMLAGPALKVVPVTIHIPLREVAARLNADAIVHCGRVAAAALIRDFGIARPRLAAAALNPHAGEGGVLGREEIEIIGPAIETLRGEGFDVAGPTPADTLFHDAARTKYDAVLCMYHDQALIPLKTIEFETGVNITLGLPFVRTSPDHGTALDIAGEGSANPASLRAALAMAGQMAARRNAQPPAAEAPPAARASR